jgi:hypothetical protein
MGPAATAGEGALSKALTGIGMPNVPASLRYSNLLGIENPTAKGIMDTMQRLGAGTGGSVPRAQPINLQPGQVVIQPRAGQRRRMF